MKPKRNNNLESLRVKLREKVRKRVSNNREKTMRHKTKKRGVLAIDFLLYSDSYGYFLDRSLLLCCSSNRRHIK